MTNTPNQTSITLRSGKSPAEICRERGWISGTKLVGDDGYGPTVIQITAIGESRILAKSIAQDGDAVDGRENIWTLDCRDWREVV